jgi:hypothetical protein
MVRSRAYIPFSSPDQVDVEIVVLFTDCTNAVAHPGNSGFHNRDLIPEFDSPEQ